MRKAFSSAIEKLAEDDRIIFLTGDLGYKALENLQEKMGERFINAGVAEQNMIGMAAGLAYKGYKVFCYSIAPFTIFRCLEQIRNDVCFHKLPVFIAGNGGGYGYGIMGSTHHAISDIACMSSLPDMTCYVPSFVEEVEPSVKEMLNLNMPAYLRLGLGKNSPVTENVTFDSINVVLSSPQPKMTVIALGPVINNVLSAIENKEYKDNIELFSFIKIFPHKMSDRFLSSVKRTQKLLVLEEHVSRGGIGEYIALNLLKEGIKPDKFEALHATYYPEGLYGDQGYHQSQSGLDVSNIQNIIGNWLNK